jgi:response regulator NasT
MSQRLRVLVADDEPTIREYVRKLVTRLGHEVVATAADGQELLDLCRRVRPDLVISDVRMPELDGVAAFKVLQEEWPVPFVFISAHLGPEAWGYADSELVLGHLVKPISRADVEQVLDLALRSMQRA